MYEDICSENINKQKLGNSMHLDSSSGNKTSAMVDEINARAYPGLEKYIEERMSRKWLLFYHWMKDLFKIRVI